MSKSLGNVISPTEMCDRYGIDATRYLLMSLGPFGNDMDVTWEKLDTTYTATLCNGLGNVASRVAKLCEKNGGSFTPATPVLPNEFLSALETFDIDVALGIINQQVTSLDGYFSTTEPWKKAGDEQFAILATAVDQLLVIAQELTLFMPATAETLLSHFSSAQISSISPLFPRLTH